MPLVYDEPINIPLAPPAEKPGFLEGLTDVFGSVSSVIRDGVKTYADVTTDINNAKLGKEIGEIRTEAIKQSLYNASPAAQAQLPSFSDFFKSPADSFGKVKTAVISGNIPTVTGNRGLDVATLGLLGLGAFILIKKL